MAFVTECVLFFFNKEFCAKLYSVSLFQLNFLPLVEMISNCLGFRFS